MKIKIKRIDQDFALHATNEEGSIVTIDAAKEIGGNCKGMRPMQLVLSALGGCSAIDVLQILKKQKQEIGSFQVEINGAREKSGSYSLFKTIDLHFIIDGNVNPVKAEQAVKLSMEKYCSVAKTLEPTAKISYKVTVK